MEHSLQQQALNRFTTKTFLWMGLGLLVSAVSAYAILTIPMLSFLVFGNGLSMWVIFIAQLFLAYSLRIDDRKLEGAAQYIVKFVLYAVLTGVTFATVTMIYAQQTIFQAFISTAALFAMLAMYGYTTKRDLSKLGVMLAPALIGIIIISVLNVIFFKSTAVELVLSIASMVVFVGLTMYDMQKIKYMYARYAQYPTMHTSLSIAMALQLYLDFINLFLSILRIFGRGRD